MYILPIKFFPFFMWLKNYVYEGDRHYSPLFEHLECHIIGRQGMSVELQC